MGNASVNLGIAGLDVGPDGAGVTILGMRVGGSGGRGFEIGFNPGVGVQVNGQGLYAGARADVAIRDGVSAAAGAKATWMDETAGAGALAAAHATGCQATAAAGLRSTAENARFHR